MHAMQVPIVGFVYCVQIVSEHRLLRAAHIVHFSRTIARGIYWCVIIGVLCIRGPHRALPAWGGFRYLRCRVCHDGFALAVKSASLSVHSVQILSVHQFFLVIFCI